jgi:hypothetical protein
MTNSLSPRWPRSYALSARKRYGRKSGTKVVRYGPEALVDDLNRLDYGPLFQEQAPAEWDMAAFERVPTTRG